MTKKCPQCSQEVPDYSKFCPHCAFAFENQTASSAKPPVQETYIACGLCGELNNQTNTVCTGCGAELSGEVVTVDAVTPQSVPLKDNKPVIKVVPPKQGAGKKPQPVTQPISKDISSTKMIWIFVSLLLLGAIIVIFGITMNEAPKESVALKQSMPAADERTTPDLSLQPKIDSLEQLIVSFPEQKELLLQLARVQDDARFYDRAIQTYKKYITAVPENADAVVDMGVCYFNLHNLDQAELLFKSALKIKSDHTQALFNLGIIYMNREKPDDASKWFNKVIESAPGSREAAQAKTLLQSHTKQ